VGDHLRIDLGLIRATGAELGQIRDALQHAEAANPGAGVLGVGGLAEAYESTDTELAKELTRQSSPEHGSPTAAPPVRAAS
jgi:hypothetical protein